MIHPGRHIFIYGDRGVGKTWLAQTAAFEHQSAEQSPILLACDPSSGFYRIFRDLASKLLAIDPTATRAEARHFTAAIKSAVQDIEPHLKVTYHLATQKYSDEYEEVLWAVADHHELKRRSSAIFNSYTRIMRHRSGRTR